MKKLDYYTAEVVWRDGKNIKASWGFYAKRDGRNVFTTKLANELIDSANKAYKEKFGKDVEFDLIKLDMSDYYVDTECVSDDGYPLRHISGKKKIGKYDKRKNILRIFEDDIPVYENNNGKICRDSAALADSLM